MSTYDDDELEFDFFDEPETVEATQRRRLPRLEMPGGRGGDRPPRQPREGGGGPTGLVPLARLVGLIAIAIVVVVGLVFWVGSCQGKSKHDEYAAYADDVRAIQVADRRLAKSFGATMIETSQKQSDLETTLAQYAQREQQEYTQAQQIRAPGPLRRIHTHLLDAIELRAKGLAALGNEIAQVPTTKTLSATQTSAIATKLADVGALLSASDVVWEQLYRVPATQELQSQGVTGVVIPPSQFVTIPDLVSARAFTVLLGHLGSASTGGTPSGLHGSALVGVHVSPQGSDLTTSSATTIRVSADLAFVVSVQDSGDFAETGVPVTLKIKAGSFSVTRKETIPTIQPKETKTVRFSSFDLPAQAYSNQVSITVTVEKVPGEKKLDNNTATYPAFFTLS